MTYTWTDAQRDREFDYHESHHNGEPVDECEFCEQEVEERERDDEA